MPRHVDRESDREGRAQQADRPRSRARHEGCGLGAPDTATPFSDTLTTLERVTPASLGLASTLGDFGHSLAAHDLTGDGLPELIIGEPGTGPVPGRVTVVLGAAAFPYIDTTQVVTLQTNLTGATVPDSFGFSLAAGPLAIGHPRSLLAIGVPGQRGDAGAVCWVGFQDSGTTLAQDTLFPLDCRENPFPQSPSDQQRFGEAIAVLDAAPLDTTGSRVSDAANAHELVVGTPGGREVEADGITEVLPTGWFRPDYNVTWVEYTDVSSTESGTVTVFRASEAGPRILPRHGATDGAYRDVHLTQVLPVSPAAGDDFGAVLGVADLQLNELPDLLIGIPERGDGEIGITRSTPINGLDQGFSGTYDTTDSDNRARSVRVLNHPVSGVSLHAEDFTFIIENAAGTRCTLDDSSGMEVFDGEATLDFHTAYFEIDNSNTASNPIKFTLALPEADVGVPDMTVDGEIWMPTTDSFRISFDEPERDGKDAWPGQDCAIDYPTGETSFLIDNPSPMVCE